MLFPHKLQRPAFPANLAGRDGEEEITVPPKALPVAKLPVKCLWARSRRGGLRCVGRHHRARGHRGGCKCTDDSCEAPASLTTPPWPVTENPSVRSGGRGGPRLAEGGGLGLWRGAGLAAQHTFAGRRLSRPQGWGGKAGRLRASACKRPPPHTRSLGAPLQTTRQHRPGATVLASLKP